MPTSVNQLLRLVIVLIVSPVVFSCKQPPHQLSESFHKNMPFHETPDIKVNVMVLEESSFRKELFSNGKLRAKQKCRIPFNYNDKLLKVFVKNGQYVQKGQVLAEQCSERLDRLLERAAIAKKQATLEMEYLLLGYGYSLGDSLVVPDHIWEMSGISSGYLEAGNQFKYLLSDLEKTILKAPFSGIIMDIDVNPYEHVNTGSLFCTLIDNSSFIADFLIMEHELQMIDVNNNVIIAPLSNPKQKHTGRIKSINPVVDENGQIKVSALIYGAEGLIEGMNVRVVIQHEIHNQMVVPKSSVLYRDNMEVLFRYEAGKAVWTYVSIVHQNSTHYSVVANPDRISSLEPGDTVITAGNMHLAHRTNVKIR